MDPRPEALATGVARPGALGKTALWVLAVQCLLALSWTLYVLFLPGMLAAAGIEKRWFVYVLIADQVIFAACDWWAGVYADRVGPVWMRLGRVMTATALLSSAALLAMPWVAKGGNAVLLLAVIFVWAATSSALRAPVFALLGRIREGGRGDRGDADANARRAGMVSMALVGISLAGAVGPYVTMLAKSVDSRLPLAISAIALAMAGLWATRAESMLPRIEEVIPATLAPARQTRQRAWALAGVVFIAAFGTQLVTAILALPLYQRFVGSDAVLWAAWFWVGFGIGLIPGARLAARARALLFAAIAMAVASIAFAFAANSASLAVLVAGTATAGGAWGVFSTVVFSSAVSLSGGRASVRGAGTASGMVFSALALATLLRLCCTAAGLAKAPLIAWLPLMSWALAGVLLVVVVRTVWREPLEASPPLAT